MKKKLKYVCSILMALTVALFLGCGCGTLLTYTGDDFDRANSKIIETRESFIFSTYNKTSEAMPIDLKVGISKTTIQEVMVAYFEFQNNSNENQLFQMKDIKIAAEDGVLGLINPHDYISVWQGEQSGVVSSMQAMGPSLRNLATISSPYSGISQATAYDDWTNSTGATKDIANVVNGIAAHTIIQSTILKPYSTSYYYVFFQATDKYPITLEYRDLTYTFGKASVK